MENVIGSSWDNPFSTIKEAIEATKISNNAGVVYYIGKTEHICKENEMYGTCGEDKVYKTDGQWWLSLDCGCCHTQINYCPYCGIKLE